MSNKILFVLIGIAIVLMMVPFVLNYVQIVETKGSEEYIDLNDINGIEVVHKGIPYTLNFKQQVAAATFLNEAKPFDPQENIETRAPTAIEKIVIYRFKNLTPIEITPIYYHYNNLVFSALEWREKGLLMENSQGQLKNLLSQTFDR